MKRPLLPVVLVVAALSACGGGSQADVKASTPVVTAAPAVPAVHAGKVVYCEFLRKPIESTGLVLRFGQGTNTCLFTGTGAERKTHLLGVSIYGKNAQYEANIRAGMRDPQPIGKHTVEAQMLDGRPAALLTCGDYDVLLQPGVSPVDPAATVAGPIEKYLHCGST